MHISPLTIYLWQLADRLISASLAVSIALTVATLFSLIFWAVNAGNTSHNRSLGEDEKAIEPRVKQAIEWMPKCRKWTVVYLILAVVWTSITSLIPTSNTVAMMVIVPRITESKVLQQDLPDIYNAAISALKKQLTP